MEIKKLFESLRSFITEEELIESRLSDVKKKYPEISIYIDYLSENDPSGKNKYLAWMAKQLALAMASGDKESAARDGGTIEQIFNAVKAFHKNAKRMPLKDINQYKTLQNLQSELAKLGQTSKEKRKAKKETAMEGSEIILDDEDFFVVRPNTEESSCYYGRNTKWCISATESRNYFAQYTGEGKLFYFLRNNHLEEDDPGKKLAFVVDYQGDATVVDEIYDAPDSSIEESTAKHHILFNLAHGHPEYPNQNNNELKTAASDAFNDLVDEMIKHAEDNPPDTSLAEARYEEIQKQFDEVAEHSSISFDFWGAGPSDVSFRGDMGFNITELKASVHPSFDWAIKPADKENEIKKILGDVLESNYVYYNEIDDFEELRFGIDFSTDEYSPNPDGYEEFADNVLDYDKKYDTIIEDLVEALGEAGYIESEKTDTLKDWLRRAPDLKHFDFSIEDNALEATAEIKANIKQLGAEASHSWWSGRRAREIKSFIEGEQFNRVFQKAIKELVVSARNMAAKQLKLPIQEEQLPYKFFSKFTLIADVSPLGGVGVEITSAEPYAKDPETIKQFYIFTHYLDKNFDYIEELFAKTLNKALEVVV